MYCSTLSTITIHDWVKIELCLFFYSESTLYHDDGSISNNLDRLPIMYLFSQSLQQITISTVLQEQLKFISYRWHDSLQIVFIKSVVNLRRN